MDPKIREKIMLKYPDIRENPEYFIIDIVNEKGEKETHHIPKRDKIDVKMAGGDPQKVSVENVVEATIKYPGMKLGEALKLL